MLDTVSPIVPDIMGMSHFTNVESEIEWTTQDHIFGK